MEAHGLTRKGLADYTAEESRWKMGVRRASDIVFSLGLLVLLAPILIAVAIAVRIDSPGPALFRQRRVGHREREFTVYKFRSMHLDADPSGHREYVTALISGNGDAAEAADGDPGLFKLVIDPRITGVGRWIRRGSIDELPQLINVLLGDMTLVGPRPTIPYEVEQYPSWYLKRFSVKPGLTGLWQVSGRSERSYEEMVQLDIEYAERRSLALDISILARTPWVVISRKGVG